MSPGAQPMDIKPLTPIQPSGMTPLPGGRLSADVSAVAVNGQSMSTGQSTRYQSSVTLVEPGKQSTQYRQLQNLLAQYQSQMQNGTLTDEQRFNLAKQEEATIQQMNKAGSAGTGVGTATVGGRGAGAGGAGGAGAGGVGGAGTLGAGGPTSQPVSPRNTTIVPLPFNSLSEGMSSRSLADIIRNAEDLVGKGEYKEAIDQYNNAIAVVPNNPMILLGRANAEIGANLYARAENDLRRSYAEDTALMMGKYNIRDLLGEKRLDVVVADLEQVADKDPTNETPIFLLAYLNYNTGQVAKVAGQLELAERLRGGRDPLIESLFQHWNLTATTQPAAGK
jgi:tetratricopeptide (TPR) repeat protein